MPIKIKNCGLKSKEMIDVAIRTGASFIGFVHHEFSPRHLELAEIAKLGAHVPSPAKRVIVVAEPSDELLDTILAHPLPEFLQVHGVTDSERLKDIHRRT